MNCFFVYILKCSDGSYYTGHTDDIEKRLSDHMNGLCSYTKNKLPVKAMFIQNFDLRSEALILENKIKKWSRRKKEALIKNDWKEISRLSQNNQSKK